MHKRSIYSLLLTSFILVFAYAMSMAQTVAVQSKTETRCVNGSLDVTVSPTGDASAFEIVLVVTGSFSSVSAAIDPAVASSMTTIVDLSRVNGSSPDTIRIAGMKTSAGNTCLSGPFPKKVATVSYTTGNVCAGTITVAGGSLPACALNPGVQGTSQFVDCASGQLAAATVTSGVVTISNVAPTIASIANATLHWGQTYTGSAVGSDANTASGCEKLQYAKVSGPAALTVNANSGAISWSTTGADVCVHTVTVSVTDSCGASAQTSFDICVQNTAPVITCPATSTNIIYGQTASGGVTGSDPDAGPGALNYQMVSFNGPGSVTVNPATGAWSWPTLENNSYIGTFTLCISVNDGAPVCNPCSPANADTCCLTIHVIPTIDVAIEKTHDTYQGQQEEVSIYLDSTIVPGNEMGGYDFLIQYDATALTFLSATPGALLTSCGWEYFTYRVGPNGNCGNSGCPTGYVRLVAIAETNNGANHPDCFGGAIGDPGQLASLRFLVTDNRTFECQYIPIRWVWYDCGDNAISSVTGDTLFISRHVYDYDNPLPIEDLNAAFPSWFGANSTCDTALDNNKPDPIRLVDFLNGGIDIVCADSIDARGDINLNDIAYEIADAVLYSRYFIYGLGVFDVNTQGQIAASDVNADGFTLSVADLVYLIRVVVGDAMPYPKVAPEINAVISYGNGTVSIDREVAAGLVVVEGNVTPELLVEGVEMISAFDGTQTRILVWPGEDLAGTFTGDFLAVDGHVVYTEFATYEGYPVAVSTKLMPKSFALAQNYPNPFNPTTTISFSLKQSSDYTLTIYNVSGQVVKTFAGTHEAGTYNEIWDAGSSASGVYYYKLVAGNFSQTKKMVLLK